MKTKGVNDFLYEFEQGKKVVHEKTVTVTVSHDAMRFCRMSLRKQKEEKPKTTNNFNYYCVDCNSEVMWGIKFCQECGKKQNWEGI